MSSPLIEEPRNGVERSGADRRRIGIFGGTFDPPHIGHLIVASEVKWACNLDEVLVVVANDPWQKSADRVVTPADIRLEMVRSAVTGSGRQRRAAGLTASSIEIDRGGRTFMIDTVIEVQHSEPDADLMVILGRDSVNGLDSWHRAEELAGLISIACVERPGGPEALVAPVGSQYPWDVRPVRAPLIDVSSTDVRERCRDGRPIDFLVPDGVRSIIADRGLYGWRR